MTKKSLQELAIKAISEVKAKIKEIIDNNKKGDFIKELPVDHKISLKTLDEAIKVKNEIDIVESKLRALQQQYKPLREEILASLPGEEKDKIEVMLNGVQIKKHIQIKNAGKLDETKMMELLKSKKLLQKTTTKVRVIDEDLLLMAIANDDLTYDEYASCLTEGKVIPVLKVEQKVLNQADQKVV